MGIVCLKVFARIVFVFTRYYGLKIFSLVEDDGYLV
jgi:hypothetical protein